MSHETQIHHKLTEAFQPMHLEVLNESYKHNVPKNSETHFKVTIVSETFLNMPLVRRHQAVNRTLAEELQTGVHALAMETKTPEEWEKSGKQSRQTPQCRGGSA